MRMPAAQFIALTVVGTVLSGGTSESSGPSAGSVQEQASPAIRPSDDTLVVTARLTEIPGKFVSNELYDYVYVMKYRVIAVHKGSCEAREILVGHYNPLIPRGKVKDKMDRFVDGTVESFTVGKKQRLTLVTPIEKVWSDQTEDEYLDSDLMKYYALRADTVE